MSDLSTLQQPCKTASNRYPLDSSSSLFVGLRSSCYPSALCICAGQRTTEPRRRRDERDQPQCRRQANISWTHAGDSLRCSAAIAERSDPSRNIFCFPGTRHSPRSKQILKNVTVHCFRVPVFKSEAKLDASFDLTGVPACAPQWCGTRLEPRGDRCRRDRRARSTGGRAHHHRWEDQ